MVTFGPRHFPLVPGGGFEGGIAGQRVRCAKIVDLPARAAPLPRRREKPPIPSSCPSPAPPRGQAEYRQEHQRRRAGLRHQ